MMKNLTNLVLTAILLLIAPLLQAQTVTTENGWNIRTDNPMVTLQVDNGGEADIFMEEQENGLRITTGPRAIYWRTDDVASGIFKINATLRLYDPKGRNREGYGLFMGGSDLNTDEIYYLYFLLRNTGDYLIKIRTGDETSIVKDWTAHNGIRKFEEGGSTEYARNELGVHVMNDTISFIINGTTVHSVGKQGLKPDGIYGLRLNHAVDLMMEELNLAER